MATPIVYICAEIAGGEDLIRTAGWRVSMLGSLDTLRARPESSIPSCLVWDVSRSGSENRALSEDLGELPPDIPVICTMGHVDLATVVSVVRAGCFDVLRMPVTEDSLLDVVRRALRHSEEVLERNRVEYQLKGRYEALSPRERQVMALIASGLMNKQVGAELGISEITVKAHRGRVMRKMQAYTFASLVKMATTLAL
jgi:FixJ family two-component response regulator